MDPPQNPFIQYLPLQQSVGGRGSQPSMVTWSLSGRDPGGPDFWGGGTEIAGHKPLDGPAPLFHIPYTAVVPQPLRQNGAYASTAPLRPYLTRF